MAHFNYLFPLTPGNYTYFALGKSVAYHYIVWEEIAPLIPVKDADDNFVDTLRGILDKHMGELRHGHRPPHLGAIQRLANWLDPKQTYTLHNDSAGLPTDSADVPTWYRCVGYLWDAGIADHFGYVGRMAGVGKTDGALHRGGYSAAEWLRLYDAVESGALRQLIRGL